MLKRIISLLLAALLAAAFAVTAVAENGNNEYYVYTENGKPLNIRNAPGGAIIGQLEYGTKVTVTANINDYWAMIAYDGDETGYAYVSRRFLISADPEIVKKAIEEEEATITGDPMTDINAEFTCAKPVEPYKITVRPARVTSWVNMRWIPSETGLIVAKYKATEELLVLKELNNYLQVQDPDTGDVGYIHKRFAAR